MRSPFFVFHGSGIPSLAFHPTGQEPLTLLNGLFRIEGKGAGLFSNFLKTFDVGLKGVPQGFDLLSLSSNFAFDIPDLCF